MEDKQQTQPHSYKEEIKKSNEAEHVAEAHEQAEKDIAKDADLSIHSPNDDLDEAETARLGDDKNDLGGALNIQ